MKNKLLSEHIKADNYLLRDFNEDFLYTGDIILYLSNIDTQFAVVEYAKFNDKEYMLLHSTFFPYFCKAINCKETFNYPTKYRFFKYNKTINNLIKDMPYKNFMHFIKIYKGVIYRKQWKELPNIISKHNFICKTDNYKHFEDYDRYTVYNILQKPKTNHYEFIFRGDNINIPF